MTPGITAVRLTGARHRAELPLLVLGPSLGTSASTLWTECARRLTDAFDVVAWDLPGHGHNRAVPDEPFTMAELAAGVLHGRRRRAPQRGEDGGPFFYAGDSVGGAVGLQLLLDRPDRVAAAALLCTGAKIGDEAMWTGRIGQVSVSGTPVMVTGSAERWFGPGFLDRRPEVGSALLHALQRGRRRRLRRRCAAPWPSSTCATGSPRSAYPVLAVAGSRRRGHAAGPAAGDRRRRAGRPVRRARRRRPPRARRGTRRPWPRCSASTSSARPRSPATTAPSARSATPAWSYAARCSATRTSTARPTATTDFTRDFQELITTYAWGSIWTRPGLDRRSRSLITLTALVARGHHEELAMHVRAARAQRAHGRRDQGAASCRPRSTAASRTPTPPSASPSRSSPRSRDSP